MSEYDSRSLNDNDVMPFGVHRGKRLGDVPASYLRWVAKQKWSDDYPALIRYINEVDDEENDE